MPALALPCTMAVEAVAEVVAEAAVTVEVVAAEVPEVVAAALAVGNPSKPEPVEAVPLPQSA